MSNEVKAQFANDGNRSRKRVKYINGSGSSKTLYEGEPFCYIYDSTTNLTGWSRSADAESFTTDEGYHNEGKYMTVENPAADNLQWFAGVSAPGSWNGKTIANGGEEWIEVYVPNGAIVPVRANCEVTVGVTVLGLASATQALVPAGRPVALAMETNATLDTTAGLVLAKLDPDMFIYQVGASAAMAFDDDDATSTIVANTIQLTEAQTAGTFASLLLHTTQTGNTSATAHTFGLLDYLALTGTLDQAGYHRTLLAQMDISATVTSGGVHMYPIMAQLTGAAPTLTTVGHIAGISVDLSLGVNPTTGNYTGILIANNGANQTQVDSAITIYGNYGINNLFDFESCDGITANFISDGGTGGATKVITSGGDWKKIKINIGGSTYYLLAMVDPSEIDNT
jgi:hypothetical protein